MALIYLRHERHGVKIATLEMEAEADEENGWVRFDPDEVTPAEESDTVRRRGRRSKVDNDDNSLRSDLRGAEAIRNVSGGRNSLFGNR